MEQYPQEPDNEINLYELGQTLFSEKLTIFSITGLFLLIGCLFSFFYPVTYQGNIVIKPVDSEMISRYRPINILNMSGLANKSDIANIVTSNKLFQLFMDELLSLKTFRAAIYQHVKEIQAIHEESVSEKDFIYNFLQKIDIVKPLERSKNKYLFHEVRFSGEDKNELYSVVNSAMQLANNNVQKNIQHEIKNIRKSILHIIENKKKSIKHEIRLAEYNYHQKVALRMAFLEEQAAIARTLGVEKNLNGFHKRNNKIDIQVNTENPFYLRGYYAIEKELLLMQSRDTDNLDKYIAVLPKLKTDLLRLESDIKIAELDAMVALTPLSNESFVAADYDLSSVHLIQKTKIDLILLVFFLVGLILSVIGVLIRNGYHQHKTQQIHEQRRLENTTNSSL